MAINAIWERQILRNRNGDPLLSRKTKSPVGMAGRQIASCLMTSMRCLRSAALRIS